MIPRGEKMIDKKDLKIISALRHNGRENITNISKRTGIPVTTIYDRIKNNKLIQKFTVLIDLTLLGYSTRATILVKTTGDKNTLKQHLLKSININNLYRINNGHDFMFDALFHTMKELEDFINELENKYFVIKHETHYIIEELCREKFLSDIQLITCH
jgi:DNA-binding Lrp family transcriptional regulator